MSPAVIQTLPSSLVEAKLLADRLGVMSDEIAVHAFPDGELRVTVKAAAAVTVVYASLDHPNNKLIALLLASEALRRCGAQHLILVAPYLCYMRQDAAFHPGEAISQKVVGKLLAGAFDRIVTVDAHLHRTRDIKDVFQGIEAVNLSAMPAIAESLRTNGFDRRAMVVGPDLESEAWVSDLAARLELPYMAARKTRLGDRSVVIELPRREAVMGRPVLLVDDLVSSGGTLAVCARALAAASATSIDAFVTHALFPPEIIDELSRAGIRSIRSTNSVPHITNAIPLDECLAVAVRREMDRFKAGDGGA